MKKQFVAGFLSLLVSGAALAQQNTQASADRPQGQPTQGRPPMVQPDFFSLGVAAGAGWTEYVDSDIVINPFPFVAFRQGRFYSNQAGVGFEIYKNKGFRFSAVTEVAFQETNRNQVSSLDDMQSLDIPLYAGLSVDVPLDRFVFTGTVQREVGLASEGWRASGSIARPIFVNRKLQLSPSVTFQWLDDRVTDYLYGVSARDVLPARARYEADNSFKLSGSLTGIYRLSDKFTLVGSSGLTWNNDEIVNSPIVDRRTVFSTFFAIGYNF